MKDAGGKTGTWHRFTASQRDDRLAKFAAIIDAHVEQVFHSVIDLTAHKRTWADFADKPRNDPYFFPFQNTVSAIAFQLHDEGVREPFDMIFDEQKVSGLRAKRWYPITREIMRCSEPEVYKIMPVEPMFRNDQDFLPIQASDFYAWIVRKKHEFTELDWIGDLLPNIKASNYDQVYDEKRLLSVLEDARALISQGDAVPNSVERLYQDLYANRP